MNSTPYDQSIDIVLRRRADRGMRLFDAMPRQVRECIASAPFDVLELCDQLQSILARYDDPSVVVGFIRAHHAKILRVVSQEHVAKYQYKLPHVAANASLMWTRPIGPGTGYTRKRRQSWRLHHQEMGFDETVY
jgi:hypothetical protein